MRSIWRVIVLALVASLDPGQSGDALLFSQQRSVVIRKVTVTPVKPDALEIEWVNQSNKTVVGICMRFKNAPLLLEEFFLPHSGVQSGASYRTTVFIDPAQANIEEEVQTFRLACTVFEDGTMEGLPEDTAIMEEVRAGRELQTERLLALIDEIDTRPDGELRSAIRMAIARITAMDLMLEDGTQARGFLANGMRSANSRLLIELRRTDSMIDEQDLASARQQLLRLRADQQQIRELLLHSRSRFRLLQTGK
ncbi:MAG: hypothetical protein KIT09_11790 [Bryobacteraceae bacterium]|nr:hypothetical protein [Bryobacteraceae bacterium]